MLFAATETVGGAVVQARNDIDNDDSKRIQK